MKVSDILDAVKAGEEFEMQFEYIPHWRPCEIVDVFNTIAEAFSNQESDDREFEIGDIRIRPVDYVVNGVVVPTPLSTPPKLREKYYYPDATNADIVSSASWDGVSYDKRLFARGLIYSSYTEALARAQCMFDTTATI